MAPFNDTKPMNCLESRRLLLSAPRVRNTAHREHILGCVECGRFATTIGAVEAAIDDSLNVRIPDAIAERVLLASRRRRERRYALAAIAASAVGVVWLAGIGMVVVPGRSSTIQAVGPMHPGVAAIAEVSRTAQTRAPVPAARPKGVGPDLERLGLVVPTGEARADYVGKCHIAGSAECEHIVVTTQRERANVMLVSDYAFIDRMLVTDQRMVALIGPAGSGAYIVVARSAEAAK